MPLFEYRCLDCKKRSTVLVLNPAKQAPAACSHCTSARVERILSRFASPKSEAARLEALADPSSLAGSMRMIHRAWLDLWKQWARRWAKISVTMSQRRWNPTGPAAWNRMVLTGCDRHCHIFSLDRL